MTTLLHIDDLHIEFDSDQGLVRAVEGVDLSLDEGRTLCLVGESGCGKTVTALAVLGLIASNGRIASGRVMFGGQPLIGQPEAMLNKIRGRAISMIFQDPSSSLNPVHSVGGQLAEALTTHRGMDVRAARREAIDLLEMVGMPDPESRLKEFPHQLSGGMAQRVMIAMALACRPRLLIADEPTTALDVTIQAQILELLRGLQSELGTTILLITHDLGVVAEMADDVAVMYCGRVVESAPVKELFAQPRHPYTRGLLASRPRIDLRRDSLDAVPGSVPPAFDLPPGCHFEPRCPHAESVCRGRPPALSVAGGRHRVACYWPEAQR